MKINRELTIAVLVCWLSTTNLASNKTRNTTEEHHTTTEELLESFFGEYGDKNGEISPQQFCNITKKLAGCGGNINSDQHGHEDHTQPDDHDDETHHDDDEEEKDEEHAEELHDDEEEEKDDEHAEDHHDDEEEDEKDGKCQKIYDVLSDQNITATDKIKKEDFHMVCPYLYALLVKQIKIQLENENPHAESHKEKITQTEVWGYSTAAITVISLSSLLVIVIIPLLGKSFYNKVMSFLVALAIGCLAGDALLHLIPHSLVPHSDHGDHDEEAEKDDQQALFRASIVFLGIYLFFLVECTMKLKLARRKKTDKRILYGAGKPQLTKQLCGSEQEGLSTKASEEDPIAIEEEPSRKSLKEFISEVKSGNRRSSRLVRDSLWMAYMAAMDSDGELATFPDDIPISNRESKRSNRESYQARKIDTLREEDSKEDLMTENSVVNHLERRRINSEEPKNSESKGALRADEAHENHENHANHDDNGNQQHHHHHHEKNIDKTTKIASLAWMVIVGDGFHNLADGLAVGAAFSASLTNGISTAIAVFCHELPHELGDFAVLVKAGMTVKQAITYNMVSAVISYMGMIVGILIGSNEASILWVLALTAGMFLYISLVDMLPELCTQLAEEDFKTGLTTFAVQNVGILTGVIIMYLISLME